MEIPYLPLKPGQRSGHMGSRGGHVEPKYECRGRNTWCIWIWLTLYACCFSLRCWITWIAYEPAHLAGVAMDTGPFCLSLSHKPGSQNLKMQVSEIGGKTIAQYQAAAVRQGSYLNTARWPKPVANLAVGNSLYWPISIGPSRCQLLLPSLSFTPARICQHRPSSPLLFPLSLSFFL